MDNRKLLHISSGKLKYFQASKLQIPPDISFNSTTKIRQNDPLLKFETLNLALNISKFMRTMIIDGRMDFCELIQDSQES
jgi:hypothetical protein